MLLSICNILISVNKTVKTPHTPACLPNLQVDSLFGPDEYNPTPALPKVMVADILPVNKRSVQYLLAAKAQKNMRVDPVADSPFGGDDVTAPLVTVPEDVTVPEPETTGDWECVSSVC